jgi:hypothetical protein
MSPRLRALNLLLRFLLITLASPNAHAKPLEPVRMIVPASNVRALPAGSAGSWWALCPERHHETGLREVTAAVSEHHRPDGSVDRAHLDTPQCPDALMLLRGLPITRSRTLYSAVLDRETAQQTRVMFQDVPLIVAKRPFEKGCRVVALWRSLEQIVAVREEPCSAIGLKVRWAGDLDGDALPDLLLDVAGPGVCTKIELFLSTRAPDGRLFGSAAEQRICG